MKSLFRIVNRKTGEEIPPRQCVHKPEILKLIKSDSYCGTFKREFDPDERFLDFFIAADGRILLVDPVNNKTVFCSGLAIEFNNPLPSKVLVK